MAYSFDELAERERRRWMKPNAHLYERPDAQRFMQPDAAPFFHPDGKRFDPYGPEGEPEPASSTARAYLRPPAAFRAPAYAGRAGFVRASALARGVGPSGSELLKLKSDLAALRVQLAVIRHENAIRKTRGLPPLTASDRGWQIILKNFARFQADCHKAGFDLNQPRVPTGNPDGGQWTDGGGGGGRINDARILSDATPNNEWKPGARYAQRRSGGGSRFGGELTPGQAARLSAIEARAQEAIRKVREVDPEWKPSPSIYETVEGLIRAREADAEQAQARFLELQRNGIGPGSFAGESIPARGPERDFTAAERREINRIGSETGCHTCGTLDPETRLGNFVVDHQPPTGLNSFGTAQRLYPQCWSCSRLQGGWVRSLRRPR